MSGRERHDQLLAGVVLAAALALGAGSLVAMHAGDEAAPPRTAEAAKAVPVTALDAAPAIDTGLEDAWAVLAVDDRLWVAADGLVVAFDPAGERVAEIPIQGKATCLTADRGFLWVGVTDHVEMFDTGTLQRVGVGENLGEGARLTSLQTTFQAIWAADAGRRLVHLLDRDGNAIGVLTGLSYADARPFAVPSPYFDLTEDEHERLFVANPGRHLVEMFERGQPVGSWGRPGLEPASFAGCCGPANLALLPGGGVVTADKGLPRVKVYEPDGTLRAMVADETQFAAFTRACESRTHGSIALDVAVTPAGRIVILEPCTGRLRFFDPPAGTEDR